MRKNWLTTVGGIMAGFSGIGLAAQAAGYHLPEWLGLTLFLIGSVGAIVVGVAAKGQDEHSTQGEVQAATLEKTK